MTATAPDFPILIPKLKKEMPTGRPLLEGDRKRKGNYVLPSRQ